MCAKRLFLIVLTSLSVIFYLASGTAQATVDYEGDDDLTIDFHDLPDASNGTTYQVRQTGGQPAQQRHNHRQLLRGHGDADRGNNGGGLVGHKQSGHRHQHYYDSSKDFTTFESGTGKTTSELQSPTGYSGIYADWNVDADSDTNTGPDDNDAPWEFGTATQYPTLKAQFHHIIRDQTDQMRHLIGDLLDVARIETGPWRWPRSLWSCTGWWRRR